jgi:hypothetical protein
MKITNFEFSPEGVITRTRLSELYNTVLFTEDEIEEIVKRLRVSLEEEVEE